MKKVLTLFIIFMFVLTSNLIAAPITVNNAGTLTNGAGNTWTQTGRANNLSNDSGLPFVPGTTARGMGDDEFDACLDADHGMQLTGGSLGGDFIIDESVFPTTHTPVAPVPEPASLLLLGLGMLSAGIFARKKNRNS